MLTKEIYKPEPKKERIARDDPRTVSELKRLDEEIVKLRTKHDKLHDSNQRKRTELNMLADKLKEIGDEFGSGLAELQGGALCTTASTGREHLLLVESLPCEQLTLPCH